MYNIKDTEYVGGLFEKADTLNNKMGSLQNVIFFVLFIRFVPVTEMTINR